MSVGKQDMFDDDIFIVILSIVVGLLGLMFAAYLAYFRVMKAEKGGELMVEISNSIKIGAKAFLKREYSYLALFVVVMFVILGIVTEFEKTAP